MISTQTLSQFPKTADSAIGDGKYIQEIFLSSKNELQDILRKNAELEAESIAAALQNDMSY